MEFIQVRWNDCDYNFPYRIYESFNKNEVKMTASFDSLALMSRHHDGYIRQLAVERLLMLFPIESVPYVVQLLSEYVVEISESIRVHIVSGYTELMREFLQENPIYARRVRNRIASYWDCYDRKRFEFLKDSPAFSLLFS